METLRKHEKCGRIWYKKNIINRLLKQDPLFIYNKEVYLKNTKFWQNLISNMLIVLFFVQIYRAQFH